MTHIPSWPFESPAFYSMLTACCVEQHAQDFAEVAPCMLAKQCLNRAWALHVPNQSQAGWCVPVAEQGTGKDTAGHTQAASLMPNKAWTMCNSNLAERHEHPRQSICSAQFRSQGNASRIEARAQWEQLYNSACAVQITQMQLCRRHVEGTRCKYAVRCEAWPASGVAIPIMTLSRVDLFPSPSFLQYAAPVGSPLTRLPAAGRTRVLARLTCSETA